MQKRVFRAARKGRAILRKRWADYLQTSASFSPPIDVTRRPRSNSAAIAKARVFARAIREAFDSLIPAVVAVIIALLFQWGEPLHWTVVLVVPLFLLIQMFGTGLMFISARITAQIPDMKTIINLAARAWFFISGVFFSVERFVDQPTLKFLMEENPAYRFLTAVRDAVMYGQAPTLLDWAILAAWGAGTLLVGFMFFWKGEGKYANVQ